MIRVPINNFYIEQAKVINRFSSTPTNNITAGDIIELKAAADILANIIIAAVELDAEK